MITLQHACRAIQGGRSYQEDAAAIASGGPSIVAVLADGMGGHAGGAIASTTICDAFLEACLAGQDDVRRRMEHGLLAANRAIAAETNADPSLGGMGATLVAVVFEADGAHWVSVGDSPLYLVRRGEIARLNEDHSLAPILDRMVAAGEMSRADAESDPRRHHLRSAITGEELDLVDISERPLALEGGDCILLASDGVHTLDEATIAAIVTRESGRGAEAVAAALVDAVEREGMPYQDNTTVVVVLASA